MSLLQIAEWLQDSQLGILIRESIWWFPLLNLAHLLSMAVAAGTIAFVDLRLLGMGLRRAPVSQIAGQLLPWTWAAFAVLFVSGGLLIVSEAVMLYHNAAAWIKAILLVAAGVNVLIFHTTVYRKVAEWDLAEVTPRRARIAGSISLACWIGLIAAGRAIPYLE